MFFHEAFVLCLVATNQCLFAASVGSVVVSDGHRTVCLLPAANGLAMTLSIDRSFEVRRCPRTFCT